MSSYLPHRHQSLHLHLRVHVHGLHTRVRHTYLIQCTWIDLLFLLGTHLTLDVLST